MDYIYRTHGTCSVAIKFRYDEKEGKVYDVEFIGGCNGNLKAISKLVDGFSVEQIEEKLLGNTCGSKPTSCADQLARAVREAKNKSESESE